MYSTCRIPFFVPKFNRKYITCICFRILSCTCNWRMKRFEEFHFLWFLHWQLVVSSSFNQVFLKQDRLLLMKKFHSTFTGCLQFELLEYNNCHGGALKKKKRKKCATNLCQNRYYRFHKQYIQPTIKFFGELDHILFDMDICK